MEEVVSPQEEEKEQAQDLTEEMKQDSAEMTEEIKEEEQEETAEKEQMVPLSALQKERKKRQEREWQLDYERQQRNAAQQQPEEDDLSQYESLTKKDIAKIQQETVRLVEEKNWIRDNRERYEFVNENLQEFLNQRPHLASAVKDAPNRYEEAWALMSAFNPRLQQPGKRVAPKREAPNSPSAVPKAAAMDQAVDLMSMSDSEYLAWRKQQKRR